MKSVVEIINELRNTSGTNDKIAILHKNKDNETLRKVLYYTYNKFLKYKISETKYKTTKPIQKSNGAWFNMFEYLSKVNMNDELRSDVVGYIENNFSEEEKEIVKCILFKDLKINMNVSTINKGIPQLIPTWEVALMKPYKDVKKWKKGTWIAIMQKMNGERGCCYLDTIYSRTGHEQTGLSHIISDLNILMANVNKKQSSDFYFDGELINKNRYFTIPDEENFRITRSTLGTKDGDKSNIEFVLFDAITKEEFDNKIGLETYSKRIERLKMLQDLIVELGLEHIRVAPILYIGEHNEQIVQECLNSTDELGLEGTMVYRDAVYKGKRTTNILKCKTFVYNDVEIIGFTEGKGKFEGTLGSVIVDYKGYPCGVGGYGDELRDEIWNNQDKYLGRVCTVKCKGETNNDNGGVSMAFPTWNKLCDIDKKVSYES